MFSESNRNIKDLLETKDYAIVFDTNIFLNLYRVSPDYADFLLDCMDKLADFIIVPHTIQLEFNKHHQSLYLKRQKSIEHSIDDSLKMIRSQKTKIHNSCLVLKKRSFPEIDKLIADIESHYNDIESCLHSYFENHSVLSLINDSWEDDRPEKLMNKLDKAGKTLPSFTMTELYKICEKGQNRYKKQIPPGYKDSKEKDGLRKYSDLIWWFEIIRWAKENKKNIILVTDDIKEDWWQIVDDKLIFRVELIKEFKHSTKYKIKTSAGEESKNMDIVPFTSNDFFTAYIDSYKIERPDAIDIAIELTDDDYIDAIEQKVIDKVANILTYSNCEYVDTQSMVDIGSEGIEEWELIDYELLNYTLHERSDETIFYIIKFSITLSGYSQEYCGRDDDTKEYLYFDRYYHEMTGEIEVLVSRTVNLLSNFLEDYDFDECEIIDASLKESKHIDKWAEDYDTCPRCGSTIDFSNDAGNGFCTKCTMESDDI